MTLTKARCARLEKLAAYLEGLPEDYRHFDMRDYMGLSRTDPKVVEYARKNGGVNSCGTVACAAGHGPAAGVLVPPRFIDKNRDGTLFVDWDGYTELFVGDSWTLYKWCFGATWKYVDGHHHGAAARIRYLLDGQPLPDETGGMMDTVALYAPYRIDAKAKADA